jgi:hypothetical protein
VVARHSAAVRNAVDRAGGEWVDLPTNADALTTLARFLTRRARRTPRTHVGQEALG